MRAVVVRHYKTLINAADQIMGWGNAPPADDWEPDLRYVNQQLLSHGLNFDAVYTSGLERSRRTGMYFAKLRNISIVHDRMELNEVNYGALYKKSKKWVEKHIPQYKTDPDFIFPGGESFRQMRERSVGYFSSLEEKHRGQNILVIAHAGVIRGLVSHYLDLDYALHLKHKISHRYIGEFRIADGVCRRYDELGKPSGFIDDGAIQVPMHCNAPEAIAPPENPPAAPPGS